MSSAVALAIRADLCTLGLHRPARRLTSLGPERAAPSMGSADLLSRPAPGPAGPPARSSASGRRPGAIPCARTARVRSAEPALRPLPSAREACP